MIVWYPGIKDSQEFGAMQVLKNDSGKHFAEVGLHVEFWDADGDGDLDMLGSDLIYGVRLYRNTGSAVEPVISSLPIDFAAGDVALGGELPEAAEEGGMRLSPQYGMHSQPLMHDWDCDGLEDLILATNIYGAECVAVCRNVGTASAPKFAEPQILASAAVPGSESEFEWVDGASPRPLGDHWRVAVGDVTGDGLDDLIVGDAGFTVRLDSSVLKADAAVREAFTAFEAAWASFEEVLFGDAESEGQDDARAERMDQLSERATKAKERFRSEYCRAAGLAKDAFPRATGMVWVFERKAAESTSK